MTDPSHLYSIQNDIFVAMKKILRNLKTEKASNKTQDYFEKHDIDLESLWKDFRANHEKLKTEGKVKKDLYFRTNMNVIAEGLYKTTKTKLHQMHQYYKMTRFPADKCGSTETNDISEINEKQELEDIMEEGNSETDAEMMNVMNIEDQNSGAEFISVELLLNELSAQTTSKIEHDEEQKESLKTVGNIDTSVLEQFDECPTRKVRCPFKDCSTYLTSKETMIRHLRVHNGEMPFQCNCCDYATYNSTRIKEHINTHSGVKPYKCSYCNYASVSKKYQKLHEAKHCKCNCGYISKNRSALTQHQYENCPLEQQKNKKRNGIICKFCKKCFANKVSSRAHRQERDFCSTCNDYVCDYTGHIKKFHEQMSNGEKLKSYKFVCNICGWKGGKEQRVLLHLIHHPQEVGDEIDVSILKKYNIL